MKQKIIIVLVSLIVTGGLSAQNTTNTPVSMYGVGELATSDGGQGRAAHGVGQVDPSGIPRLAVQGVHHQGQGGQGEQLIEKVHRQHIGGESDAQSDPQAGQIKGKEPVLPSLPAHILRRIQTGQGPQDGHQHGKDTGQPIHPEGDGQPLPQGQQLEYLFPPQREH